MPLQETLVDGYSVIAPKFIIIVKLPLYEGYEACSLGRRANTLNISIIIIIIVLRCREDIFPTPPAILLLWISLRIINALRSLIKHSKECFMQHINTSKLAKKKLGRASFLQPTSLDICWTVLPCCVIYYFPKSLIIHERKQRKSQPWRRFGYVIQLL